MPRKHYAPNGVLLFYGGPLSSFANRPTRIVPAHQGAPTDAKPVLYDCREAYFQAAKATSLQDHNWILYGDDLVPDTNTWHVKERGNQVQLRDDWETVKYDVMLAGIRAECEQHDDFRTYLTRQRGRRIEEDSPTDVIWGIKKRPDGTGGLNLLGLALMQVSAELTGDEILARVLREEALRRLHWDHWDLDGQRRACDTP